MVGGGRAGVIAVGVRGWRRWHIESPSTEFELVGAMAVGEQAVVTDAMEAGWEDVEQEAAHELAGVETHQEQAAKQAREHADRKMVLEVLAPKCAAQR